MCKLNLYLNPTTYLFYRRVAEATGKTVEEVISDALFKLAGELSLEAIQRNPQSFSI